VSSGPALFPTVVLRFPFLCRTRMSFRPTGTWSSCTRAISADSRPWVVEPDEVPSGRGIVPCLLEGAPDRDLVFMSRKIAIDSWYRNWSRDALALTAVRSGDTSRTWGTSTLIILLVVGMPVRPAAEVRDRDHASDRSFVGISLAGSASTRSCTG
jgi:hypothetical protein